MIDSLPPGLILIAGALAIPFLRGRLQQAWLLALPVLSGLHLLALPRGTQVGLQLLGYELMPVRVDGLSLVWGYVFHIAAFVSALYALHVKDRVQHVTAMMYVGAAIGAVFAGDLITLFVYWEGTAITSVFLIWASRSERAYRAGVRYLVIQVGSGVLLLAGIILRFHQTGSLAFGAIADEISPADLPTLLIFLSFGIKAAFPLLHNWLQDAYPEATPTGTVFLSAFTTKLAIYALARGFAGTDCLIWIGATMTAFPIFYAVIENDLRRVLSYSLNNQLGFMVVGIGIGTPLALNGTAAHAFAHILYKGLLFMSMGAVLFRTGTCKGSELGGLYKSMPWTAVCCSIGAASISAFPFFSGFVSKSLILAEAANHENHVSVVVFLVLLFASAGVFHHSGIKIPYFAFFAHDRGLRVKEAPWNMLLAMGITAALCVLLGCVPSWLYALLPYGPDSYPQVEFHPYTAVHVVTQYQLLIFSALAFTLLMRTGIYPPELRSTNVDSDWAYRRLLPGLYGAALAAGGRARAALGGAAGGTGGALYRGVYRLCGPRGVFARTWSTGGIALWATLGLLGYLLLYFW